MMTIQKNICLRMPPDHPLAIEFYDLVHVRSSEINNLQLAAARSGDRDQVAKLDLAMQAINAAVEKIRVKFRQECGADNSCTVGFTTNANLFPVVKGRTDGPSDTCH
jgi:hypothetical protein